MAYGGNIANMAASDERGEDREKHQEKEKKLEGLKQQNSADTSEGDGEIWVENT